MGERSSNLETKFIFKRKRTNMGERSRHIWEIEISSNFRDIHLHKES